MIITRWSPLAEMETLQKTINRLFVRFPGGGQSRPPDHPPVNLWRGSNGVAVTVCLPGYGPDYVEVTTNHNTITIRDNRQPTDLKENEVRHADERHTGEFQRTFELPFDVDVEITTATFTNSVLHISLVRPDNEKSKKVARDRIVTSRHTVATRRQARSFRSFVRN